MPSDINAINQALNQNPRLIQALSSASQQRNEAFRSHGPGGHGAAAAQQSLRGSNTAPADVYRQFGIDLPDAEDYDVVQNRRTGQYELQRHGFWTRNMDWLIPVIAFGTMGVGSALAGGGAAAGAGGATTTSIPAAGGLLGSTSTIGASALPAGGAGIASGAGTAAALGGVGTASSLLGRIGKGSEIAADMAGTLGDAASSMADNSRQNNADSLAQAMFRLRAPGERLSTGLRADMASRAQPVRAEWGGPGSGLRGETVHYSGGLTPEGMSPEARRLSDTTLHNSLTAALTNDTDLPDPNDSSLGEDLLGGASLAAGLYGAFSGGRRRRQQQQGGQ